MSTQTENIGLVKQTENEHYDINIANENLDKIDTNIKKIAESKAPNKHTHSMNDIEGFKANAESIDFNKTGTNLISDKVQGSIVEINNKAEKNKTDIKVIKDSISSSVNSISTTDIANSKAVKTAYDKGVEALTKAGENETSISELKNELGTNKITLENNINAIKEVLECLH